MPAIALDPKPEWEVIDACAAPGNKTVHLAALMKGKGKIIACELNKERVERLKNNVKLAAATNVKGKHEDFLNLDPTDPSYSKDRAILLDPSCSGSGTAFDRLDHLLPSHSAGEPGHVDTHRLHRLAAFQKKVLEHALSFPAVERIVYSICSIHQMEIHTNFVEALVVKLTEKGKLIQDKFEVVKWVLQRLLYPYSSLHVQKCMYQIVLIFFWCCLLVDGITSEMIVKKRSTEQFCGVPLCHHYAQLLAFYL